MNKQGDKNRDSIDWGKTNISKLYLKILIPTLLGMISSIVVTITDGFFVGQYAGSDALAAVNISAPLFLISTGFALMFGIGSSVVASVHLSKQKLKAARINITQAIIVSEIFFVILSLFVFVFSEEVSILLGSTQRLLPLVNIYIKILSISLPFYVLEHIGLFIIRLDGSPKYAMLCSLIPAIINTIADYVLVAELEMGIKGAVWATSGSLIFGGLMVVYYMLFMTNKLKMYRLKLTKTSLRLTVRNIGYMCKLGFSGMLGEVAIASMMVIGNFVFLKYLGEDGIAAYSVACYYFPIIFMINNAIFQSAQPIISYNYGSGQLDRVNKTFRLTLKYAVSFSIITTIGVILFSSEMTALFLDTKYPAFELAANGLPYFASGYLFFAINMMYMGYYISIENFKFANYISIMRGYLFMLIFFITLPKLIGLNGIWLAVPASELITFLATIAMSNRIKKH